MSAKIKSVAVLTAVLATFSGAFAVGDESKGPDWSMYKWAEWMAPKVKQILSETLSGIKN